MAGRVLLLLSWVLAMPASVQPFNLGAPASRTLLNLSGGCSRSASAEVAVRRGHRGVLSTNMAIEEVDFSLPLRGRSISRSTVVQADLEECYKITADFGQTMNWASRNGMKEVNVLERDPDGGGVKVEFVAKPPLGPLMKNVLVYDLSPPDKIRFRSLSGNVMKTLDGQYTFKSTPKGTSITYELAAEFPGGNQVPAFIQEQITGIIAQTAIFELSSYIKKNVRRR